MDNISNNIVDEFEHKYKYLNRSEDKGIINDKTGASIALRDDGDIALAASSSAQYKINTNNNSATEINFQKNIITNRLNVKTDEIVVNNHKLNPNLHELTNFKNVNNNIIGNFTMFGTVLVKAWEPNLNKYVLIRRQVRLPMFSNILNTPDVPKSINVNSDIKLEFDNLYKKEEK